MQLRCEMEKLYKKKSLCSQLYNNLHMMKTIFHPFKTLHYIEQYISLIEALLRPENVKSRLKLKTTLFFSFFSAFHFLYLSTLRKYTTVEHLMHANFWYLIIGHHQFNFFAFLVVLLICYSMINLFVKPSVECIRLMRLLQKILINGSKNQNKHFSTRVRVRVQKSFLLVLNAFHSFTLFLGH